MKKKDEEKSKSKPEETIAERVKLRRQKADNDDLSDLSLLEGYVRESTDVPPMPPLEVDEEEVKEGKGSKF